mgnify:CR=1 FL=1
MQFFALPLFSSFSSLHLVKFLAVPKVHHLNFSQFPAGLNLTAHIVKVVRIIMR